MADEIVVDVMRSAGGIDHAEAATDLVVHDVDGVSIPLASPRLLWRMKAVTYREKVPPTCCSRAIGSANMAKTHPRYNLRHSRDRWMQI